MNILGQFLERYNGRAATLGSALLLLALVTGCGGSGAAQQAISADEAGILQEIQFSGFFTDNLTDTHTEEDDTAALQSLYLGESTGIKYLASEAGTAALPSFWWRGNIELLHRNIDISIVDDTASVTVTNNLSGDFFIINQSGDVYVLWDKPFEDTVVRHAEFVKGSGKWNLSKISPVELALTDFAKQTVQILWVRASVDGIIIWQTDSAAALFAVPDELPVFTPGEEVLMETSIENSSVSGFEPASFVFLHRPCSLYNKRVRDIMYDDGTNGDITAGDGIFSRTYTIGSNIGKHFAAVDVLDSATFMDIEAPYNSNAWGMPYIVE